MDIEMARSIEVMLGRVQGLVPGNSVSVVLYGSVVSDDFRLGWSDIDVLCLTEGFLTDAQCDALVPLRQVLMAEAPGNPYYRLFEGAILPEQAFMRQADCSAVYWGTSGQRRVEGYRLDPFSRAQIHGSGKVLCGRDFRAGIPLPSRAELVAAVRQEYGAVRTYAQTTRASIHAAGWLFDIARCLYTLRTGLISPKTTALTWALAENLCPDRDIAERALAIRKNPLVYAEDAATKAWCATLGGPIQRFADVLEAALHTA